MPDQQYPEPCVGALVVNQEGKVLLVKTHKWNGMYCVVGGHVEVGETMEQALIREVKEETGLDVFDPHFLAMQEVIFPKNFYKKKHYIFWDFSVTSKGGDVKLNEEAEEFVWVTPEEALKLNLEPYTRPIIEKYKEMQSK